MFEKLQYALQLCKKQPFTLTLIILCPACLMDLLYVRVWGPEGVGLLAFAVVAVSRGAFIRAIDAIAHDEHATVQSAYAVAFKKIGSLVWNSYVVSIFTIFATLLFLIPGIYLFARYSLVPYTIMLEERRSYEGPRDRGWNLTRGNEWQIVCMACFTFLPYFALHISFSYMDGYDSALLTIMGYALVLAHLIFIPFYAFLYACFAETAYGTVYTRTDEESISGELIG